MMSSGWIGPGANSSPQNQQQLEMYKSLKAQVEKDEQERKDARNAERAAQGLPPGQHRYLSEAKMLFERKLTMFVQRRIVSG